jgi:hypothetical protein
MHTQAFVLNKYLLSDCHFVYEFCDGWKEKEELRTLQQEKAS